jgi:hypothetical protein
MFTPSPTSGAFHQGEILSDVIQVQIDVENLNSQSEEIELDERIHPQAIILTQDCDLDKDFKAREQKEIGNTLQFKSVPNVLLCELIPSDTLRGQMRQTGGGGSKEWTRIIENREFRYHSFPAVLPKDDRVEEGLPALVADFKRVFTVPTEELYLRVQQTTRRRSFLNDLFVQDLGCRFGYYCLRVALPEMLISTPDAPP